MPITAEKLRSKVLPASLVTGEGQRKQVSEQLGFPPPPHSEKKPKVTITLVPFDPEITIQALKTGTQEPVQRGNIYARATYSCDVCTSVVVEQCAC